MDERPKPIPPLMVIAGMSRAGTTFLYHNLQKHPDIFLPTRKEVCFFGHNHDEGEGWFRRFYRGQGKRQVAFDICGLYFLNQGAIDRITRFDPRAKVILGVRDPVEWAFSLHEQYRGTFDVPALVEFFSGCSFVREGKEIRLDFHPGVIEESVNRFRTAFGERLLIYDFRLLGRDALALLRAIESFAGLEPYFAPGNFTDTKINARGRRRSQLVDRLLQVGGVANLLSRVVPRSVLLAVRRWMEVRGAKGVGEGRRESGPAYSQEEVRFVRGLFERDRQFVAELFSHGPLLTGRD